jgi:hypothetical protein
MHSQGDLKTDEYGLQQVLPSDAYGVQELRL